jgi:hypothetical protein
MHIFTEVRFGKFTRWERELTQAEKTLSMFSRAGEQAAFSIGPLCSRHCSYSPKGLHLQLASVGKNGHLTKVTVHLEDAAIHDQAAETRKVALLEFANPLLPGVEPTLRVNRGTGYGVPKT